MSDAIRVDDILAQPRAIRKGPVHSVRLTEEQKSLVLECVSRIGSEKTAEIVRRGIEAAIMQAIQATDPNTQP